MRIIKIYADCGENVYYLNTWLGMLLVKARGKSETRLSNNNSKLMNSYKKVLNPYELSIKSSTLPEPYFNTMTKIYAKLLVFICNKSFLFGRIFLTVFPAPKFKTTQEAIAAFRAIFPGIQQRTLCLPRTFFAIATSQSFKKLGAGFIGSFLPSRKLHAWIIEDGRNPDPNDDIWICYQPVAGIY